MSLSDRPDLFAGHQLNEAHTGLRGLLLRARPHDSADPGPVTARRVRVLVSAVATSWTRWSIKTDRCNRPVTWTLPCHSRLCNDGAAGATETKRQPSQNSAMRAED